MSAVLVEAGPDKGAIWHFGEPNKEQKESVDNWALLKDLERISLLGFPLLVGASRKRFLGELLDGANTDDRESASIAITTLLARMGIWGVRTHSVKPHKDAIKVVERWMS